MAEADATPGDDGPFAQGRPEGEQRQIAAALGLLQRLPPKDLEANLGAFAQIAPHLERTLEPYVARPLQVKRDDEQNRHFIACEYNLDGESHRSPWSNKYFPAPRGKAAEEEKLSKPSDRLRLLEETFNEVFDAYKTGYYDGGVSSVYLWDLDEGFGGAFLIRKELSVSGASSGVWDSVHLVEARDSASQPNLTEYKLTASVRMWVQVSDGAKSDTNLDAWVTRTVETRGSRGKKATAEALGDDIHLHHIGRMIEETEIRIRQYLESVAVAKQREVLQACRLPVDPDDEDLFVPTQVEGSTFSVPGGPSPTSAAGGSAAQPASATEAGYPAPAADAADPAARLRSRVTKGVSFGGVQEQEIMAKQDAEEIPEKIPEEGGQS